MNEREGEWMIPVIHAHCFPLDVVSDSVLGYFD